MFIGGCEIASHLIELYTPSPQGYVGDTELGLTEKKKISLTQLGKVKKMEARTHINQKQQMKK